MSDSVFSKGALEPEWGKNYRRQFTSEFWHSFVMIYDTPGVESAGEWGPEPKFARKTEHGLFIQVETNLQRPNLFECLGGAYFLSLSLSPFRVSHRDFLRAS